MLKLHSDNACEALILPAKQILDDLDCGTDLFRHQYFIEPNGVRKQAEAVSDQELTTSMRELRVTTQRFQGNTQGLDMHPSVRRFLNTLKKLGVKPEHETPFGCIALFDVSSNTNLARYRLSLYRGGIWPIVLARGMDRTVVENVRRLDQQISRLARECNLPEREGWKRLKRVMVAIADVETNRACHSQREL